ncbi:MAG: hypothetical protein FWF78_11240 [Defluviitaleaceae bacterium]|nr:hypothetical protein [Defluviitaleaceae bacterium]
MKIMKNEGSKDSIVLTSEQGRDFSIAFKISVLKQLHSKKLLSDEQLNQLILLQKQQLERLKR